MASLPPRDLKIGTIIDKTLAVLERNAGPALVFVVVLSALCVPITYFAVGSTSPLRLAGGELLKALVGMVGAYFLLVAMIGRTGLGSRTGGDALLPYIGLSILYSLGVLLGLIAVILPGLIVMARWSLAQPLLVARGDGIMASLGESWERTKGMEFKILVAALALIVVPIIVLIAAGSFFGQENLVGIAVSQFASSAVSAVMLAMGVALYGLIVRRGNEASAFE